MTHKYGNKEYERIPSGPICLGCDLYDARSAKCLHPEDDPDCMETDEDEGGTFFNHFRFKEIKL